MEKTRSHFTAFLEFAKTQKTTRVIYHAGGWCGCAVGDFAKDVRQSTEKGSIYLVPDDYNDLLSELEAQHAGIYEVLNSTIGAPETYGELAHFMEINAFEMDPDEVEYV